jgi:hypothetical protein
MSEPQTASSTRPTEQNAPQTNMEMLGGVVRSRGATYKLVERRENVAIYEGRGGFEVWIIDVRGAEVLNGRKYPAREVPPSSESWGSYGWTYTPASHTDPLRYAKARMEACLKHPGKKILGSELKRFLPES